MKRIWIAVLLSLLASGTLFPAVTSLKNLKVDKFDYVTMVELQFSEAFAYRALTTVPGKQILLYFRGVDAASFRRCGVVQNFRRMPMIKSAELAEANVDGVRRILPELEKDLEDELMMAQAARVPGTILLLDFVPDKVALSLVKAEDSLVFAVYERDMLETLRRKSSILHLAQKKSPDSCRLVSIS